MTATKRKLAPPGSAPPVRTVTDAEVARHFPLVEFTLNRMKRRGQLGGDHVEWEDRVAVARWAVWEALRRWDPSRGTQSTYLSSYIVGYVLKHQRDVSKAVGWHRTEGRIAHVGSYEAEILEDLSVLDTLAAPDDTAEQAQMNARLDGILQRIALMPASRRAVASRILRDEPPTGRAVARELGVSTTRAGQIARDVRRLLDATGSTEMRKGVLLVDRTVHPTEQAATVEAEKVRPNAIVLKLEKRKVRHGQVVAPQGRPDTEGRLGRPVWAITLVEAA